MLSPPLDIRESLAMPREDPDPDPGRIYKVDALILLSGGTLNFSALYISLYL